MNGDTNNKDAEYEVILPVGMGCSDFNWSREAKCETLIHRQLLCDMTARIERNVAMARDLLRSNTGYAHSQDDYPTFNMNYLITGVRGSGKSVFMNLLVKSLTRELNPFEANDTKKRRFTAQRYIDRERENVSCRFLCHYDPTSGCNQPGFFFLYLLSALQSTLEKIIAKGHSWGEAQDGYVRDCKFYLKKLNKGAVRLSMGKQAFGQLTEYQSFHMRSDDPELDQNIRRNFAGALDALCKLCGVDAFIVAVDDADTRTEQCIRVLEELRLYIANPRLIVLVAGDMSLYTERVREQYFCEYNRDYHEADKEGQVGRMNSVVSHAGQYMIKLFPLMHQYELCNILTLTTKAEPISLRLRAQTSSGKALPWENANLVSVVRRVFSAVISAGGADVEAYVKQFCCLPLRSIIHILNFWTVHSLWDSWGYILKMSDYPRGNQKPVTSQPNQNHKEKDWEYRHLVRTVQLSLIRALTDEIRHSDCKFSTVNVEERRMLFALMLRHCQNMNDLEHGFFLSGDIGRSTTDKFTTLLLAVASRSVTDTLDGFLFYLLFGPATVSLFAKAVEQSCREMENRNALTMDELREKFDRYLHVGSWSSPTRWARHANMIWCLDGNFEGLHSGVLRLRAPEMVRLVQDVMFSTAGKLKEGIHFGRVDSALHNRKLKTYQSIALLVSMGKSSDRDNSYFISVFSLLAFIMKCIQRCDYEAQLPPQQESGTDTSENEKKEETRGSRRTENKEKEDSYVSAIVEMIKDYALIKVCRNPEWLIRKDDIKMFNSFNINALDYMRSKEVEKDIKSLAIEIAEWYCKNINPGKDLEVKPDLTTENQANRANETNQAKETTSILRNNLTPRCMGQIWSDLYYGIKQICYEVKSCPLSNADKEVNKSDYVYHFLLSESDCLEKFSRAAEHLYHFFNRENPADASTLKASYMKILSGFPLMKPFMEAAKILNDSWKSQQNNLLPDENDNLDFDRCPKWHHVPEAVRKLVQKKHKS